MRSLAGALVAVLCLAACGGGGERGAHSPVTVFAAASTTDVLGEAGRRFEAATGVKVVFSFDSSSNLAKQIMAGAPADLFVSADEKWMDELAKAGAIRTETRANILANTLVMIAPAQRPFDVEPVKEFDFAARLPQVERIAVGDPSHVPAGRYAREALESLGWWEALEGRLVPALDVRAALRLVEIGEADAGIVYSTDAEQSEKVVIVARFPAGLHEPVRYPIALCRDSPGAAEFVELLRGEEMARVFEEAGFRVLPKHEEK